MTKSELKDAIAFASDPSTDRTFLAFKFLEATLRGVSTLKDPFYQVAMAFQMADEFIRQAKVEELNKSEVPK